MIEKYNKYNFKESSTPAFDFEKDDLDKLASLFPAKENDIRKIVSDILKKQKRQPAEITKYKGNNSKFPKKSPRDKYNWAETDTIYAVELKDRGLSNVTASGTYHARKGHTLLFHCRTSYRDENGEPKISYSINLTYNRPGGMVIYDSNEVFDKHDVAYYIERLLQKYKSNNITNDVY